jgi:hypothetical protein
MEKGNALLGVTVVRFLTPALCPSLPPSVSAPDLSLFPRCVDDEI